MGCIDSSVIYMPLSVHVTKLANRKPQYLVIHYTAGGSSYGGSAKQMKNIFTSRKASADFGVDDTDMVQFNPDINNYFCWAVGDKKYPQSSGGTYNGKATNKNCISIEICSNLKRGTDPKYPNHEGWYYTDASINNAIKLAKIIMNKYNIPLDRVIRHYDVSGKLCPGVIGWNNEKITNTTSRSNSNKWIEFKKLLSNGGTSNIGGGEANEAYYNDDGTSSGGGGGVSVKPAIYSNGEGTFSGSEWGEPKDGGVYNYDMSKMKDKKIDGVICGTHIMQDI